MSVTRSDVMKIAELAKLHFAEDELEAFTGQFLRILEYIEKLKEVNIEGVSPTSHVSLTPGFEKHLFRPDEVKTSLGSATAVANAPDARDGQFRVPKVL